MPRTFTWTPTKERALALIDDGVLSQREIAGELRTTRRTVEGWARRPAFRERLESLQKERMARWNAEFAAHMAALRAEAEREAAEEEADYQRWLVTLPAAWKARRQHRTLPEGHRCNRG